MIELVGVWSCQLEDTARKWARKRRGKGVVIVLTGHAVRAWKAGGSRWRACSSSLITATLVTGRDSCEYLHILSCYYLAFTASREEKDEFYDILLQALSMIPSGDQERTTYC